MYIFICSYGGCSDGVVVTTFASHQCGSGSSARLAVICQLSLLVLYSAPRGFSPGTQVFPSPQEQTIDLNWFVQIVYFS